jgi:hypothetical protein
MRFSIVKRIFSILILLVSLMISIGVNVTLTGRYSSDDRESDKSYQTINPTISATDDWNRTWGDVNDNDNAYGSDIYNKTGDIYITGSTDEFGTDDLLLIKYNKTGDLKFNVTWDNGLADYGLDVAVDQKTGDVYVTGKSESATFDLIILKYNSTGGLNWSVILDSGGYDQGYGLDVDSDSNVIVTGQWTDKVITVKYNSTKDQKWLKIFGVGTPNFDVGKGITVGSNDNVYIVGVSYNDGSLEDDILVLKYNSTGDPKGAMIFLGPSGMNEAGNGIAVDSQNNIYITGYQQTASGGREVVVYKIVDNGVSLIPEWGAEFGYGGTTKAEGEDIFIDNSDNLYIAVYLSDPTTDLVLYKLKNTGDISCYLYWDGGNTNEKYARSVAVDYSNNLYLIGVNKSGPSDEFDIILLKNPTLTCPRGPLPGGGGDDDDDDDDEGLEIVMIVIVISIVSVGAVVAVIVVLIKKGIIKPPTR